MSSLYTNSTQYKNWTFTNDQLSKIRENVHKKSLKSLAKSRKLEKILQSDQPNYELLEQIMNEDVEESSVNDLEGQIITSDDQIVYTRYWESKIMNYCTVFNLDLTVQATAIILFKRFYIKNSILEYDPRIYLMTSLFLAAKCENSTISLKDYLSKIPNAPAQEKMQEFEFKFSEGISFDYMVHSPYWAVHGFYLDMQAWLSSDFNKDVKMQKDLLSVLSLSTEKATNLLLTDLILLYTPSQLGLGCFVDAAKEVGLGELTDGYISHCWKSEAVEILVELRVILTSISSVLSKYVPPQAKDAKRVDLILKQCRNSAYDPDSDLYKWMSVSKKKKTAKFSQEPSDPFNSSHSSAEDLPAAT